MFNNYFFLLKKESQNYCQDNFNGYLKVQTNDNICNFELLVQNLNFNKDITYKCYLVSLRNGIKTYYVGNINSDESRLDKKIELENALLEGLKLDDYTIFCIYAISLDSNKTFDIVCSSNKNDTGSWKHLITPEVMGLSNVVAEKTKIERVEVKEVDKCPATDTVAPQAIPQDYIAICYFKRISSILASSFTPTIISNIDSNYTFYEITDYNILSYLFFSYGLGHLLLTPNNCSINFNEIRKISLGINIHSDCLIYVINNMPIYISLTTGNIKKNDVVSLR